MKYYVGVDLGGTNIAAGVVDSKYNIIGMAKAKTNMPRPAIEIAADMSRRNRRNFKCRSREERCRVDRDRLPWFNQS